jgi:cytochrome c553
MVTLGAGTFQTNCQFCHGKPGKQQPPVAQGMTPTPPLLRESLPSMNAQEMFYILKHGVKFAGMPAWPTMKRDDEIWPVVVFLQQLPSMEHQAYLYLTRTTIDDPASMTESFVTSHCASCHGIDGNQNVSRRVPVLAGQNREYLARSLRAYRDMTRHSGVMMPIAYRLTDSQNDDLANYFSGQTREATDKKPGSLSDTDSQDAESIQLGKRLASQGDASEKIPSCVDCHGSAEWLQSNAYPRPAGQPAWYIVRQLELFSKKQRGGDEAEIMHPIADKLDDKTRHAIAAYYANASLLSDENGGGSLDTTRQAGD